MSIDTSTPADTVGPVTDGLTAGPTGTLVRPGDAGWDVARTPWVVNLDQRPAAVALVRSAEDVAATVRSARAAGLRVTAQGTGHGAAALRPLADTVLIRTAGLRDVVVDPASESVWAGAGAEWQDVTAAASEHGLTALAGSAPDVGIAGYLLAGGISWLARSRGLAVNSILAVELVTADGQVRIVDADHEPDLFWAVRGGGGHFGVVTAFRMRLHRVESVTAGTLFFPMERAHEILTAWRQWIETVPRRTMSCGRLLQFPPMPELPEPLRGQAFVVVEVAHEGTPAELEPMLAELRAYGPVLDTVAPCPPAGLSALHMDPPGPTPCTGDGSLLDELTPEAIDAVVATAGVGSGSPLLSVEFRHLGGAIAEAPAGAGAVNHFDAGFAFYAVGVTPDPATTEKVAAAISVVADAMSPWAAGVHYANFSEKTSGLAQFHDAGTVDRLRAVKRTYDPVGLIGGAHSLD